MNITTMQVFNLFILILQFSYLSCEQIIAYSCSDEINQEYIELPKLDIEDCKVRRNISKLQTFNKSIAIVERLSSSTVIGRVCKIEGNLELYYCSLCVSYTMCGWKTHTIALDQRDLLNIEVCQRFHEENILHLPLHNININYTFNINVNDHNKVVYINEAVLGDITNIADCEGFNYEFNGNTYENVAVSLNLKVTRSIINLQRMYPGNIRPYLVIDDIWRIHKQDELQNHTINSLHGLIYFNGKIQCRDQYQVKFLDNYKIFKVEQSNSFILTDEQNSDIYFENQGYVIKSCLIPNEGQSMIKTQFTDVYLCIGCNLDKLDRLYSSSLEDIMRLDSYQRSISVIIDQNSALIEREMCVIKSHVYNFHPTLFINQELGPFQHIDAGVSNILKKCKKVIVEQLDTISECNNYLHVQHNGKLLYLNAHDNILYSKMDNCMTSSIVKFKLKLLKGHKYICQPTFYNCSFTQDQSINDISGFYLNLSRASKIKTIKLFDLNDLIHFEKATFNRKMLLHNTSKIHLFSPTIRNKNHSISYIPVFKHVGKVIHESATKLYAAITDLFNFFILTIVFQILKVWIITNIILYYLFLIIIVIINFCRRRNTAPCELLVELIANIIVPGPILAIRQC